MMLAVLAAGLFGFIPWSVVILAAIVVVGLLLIRTAVTLVKIGILVAIAVGAFLLVQYVLNNFGF